MALTPVGTPDVQFQDANVTNALVSGTLTVQTSDILVIKQVGADSGMLPSLPTIGGVNATFSVLDQASAHTCIRISTYIIPSGTTAVVTSTWAGGNAGWHSMVVETWRGGQLAGTPATNAIHVVTAGGTGFSGSITTVANNSVVSWLAGDWAAVAFGSIGWRSSATTDGATSNRGGDAANYSTYYAYQAAAASGVQTFGLTTPAASTFLFLAIEIQASGGAPAVVPELTMGNRGF